MPCSGEGLSYEEPLSWLGLCPPPHLEDWDVILLNEARGNEDINKLEDMKMFLLCRNLKLGAWFQNK